MSDDILNLCEQTLLGFKAKGDELGVTEWNGIATAVFRKAKNGPDFISRMYSQHSLPIGIVNQKLEGQLGFLSAQAVAPGHLDSKNIISWDLGGGSFQLTDSSYNVYEGPCGSTFALSASLRLKGIAFSPKATPLPMSKNDFEMLLASLTEALSKIPTKEECKRVLKEIKKPESQVIAIGGTTCAFRMCAMVQKQYGPEEDSGTEYSLLPWSADALHGFVAEHMLEKEDAYFIAQKFPQANMLLPKIALVIAIMKHFQIQQVLYCPTNGNTEGMLLF